MMNKLKHDATSSSCQMTLVSTLILCLYQPAWAMLPDTGQDECYDVSNNMIACPAEGTSLYGQDAQYTKNLPSYTDNNDGTITDNTTQLTWQKDPDTNGDGVINTLDKKTYSEVLSGTDALNAAALGGCTAWRVPTIKELYSLIDYRGMTGNSQDYTQIPDDGQFYIDTTYFEFDYGDIANGDRYIDAQYWSSTDYVGEIMDGRQGNFGVNFVDGRIKGYGAETDNARYVRYVCGDAYGVNDFVDNGDETITDNNSSLMWLQNDSGAFETGYTNNYAKAGSLDWEEALAWCEGLEFAGYTDWHLPNAKELQSIVDYTRSPSTTDSAAIDPLFKTTKLENGINDSGEANYPYYWSSTSHLNGSHGFAVYVAFGEARGYMQDVLLDVHGAGAQRSDPKTGDPTFYQEMLQSPQGDVIGIYNFARCVRDVTVDNTTDPTTPLDPITTPDPTTSPDPTATSDPITNPPTIPDLTTDPVITPDPIADPVIGQDDAQTADDEADNANNVITTPNTMPEVTDVSIIGQLRAGQILTGGYTFNDVDNDADNSAFQWYRADDAQGNNAVAIAGAVAADYTLTTADTYQSIKFCVMPSDGRLTAVPDSENKEWAALNAEEQAVAAQLGYNQAYWDDVETATPALNPSTSEVRQPEAGEDLETFWNGFSWADLTAMEQSLWQKLGWNEMYWDGYGEIAFGYETCSAWSTSVKTSLPPPMTIPVSPLPDIPQASPATGTLDGIYKANGEHFADLILTRGGNLSGAVLSGNIINAGWISNATIMPRAVVTGGTLTGFITNNGTLVDITFRGALIKGGMLKGEILNKYNGFIRDVTLAADTHIIGGKLQGLIKGDCTAPAVLESVIIDRDSTVSCVILGKNVTVEKGAIIKDEEEDTIAASPMPDLPELGQARATDKAGDPIETAAIFMAGSAVNDNVPQKEVALQKLADTVDIQGAMLVDPDDVGEKADIIVYAAYRATSDDEPVYLMLDGKGGYHLWDEDVASLVAFEKAITLEETQFTSIYQGVLLYEGILEVSFGYRKQTGTVVLSPEMLKVTVVQ